MSKPNILLVEDDYSLGFLMKDNLEEKYHVTWIQDGKQVIKVLRNEKFHLCLLDVMLPGEDGFSLAESIRETDQHIPILFVSARSQEEDRLKGFLKGGDDYITKPFSMQELILRIEVFIKRSGGALSGSYQVGSYTFMPDVLTLQKGDYQRKLTRRESEVLTFLIRHKNEVIKREKILNALWGKDDYFNGRSLDVFISKLRKYLSEDQSISIENYHAVGFRFKMEG